MSAKSAAPTRTASALASEAAVYGFVGYLASTLALGAWLVLALVPDQVLDAAGLTYRPSKYWTQILPVYALGLIPFILCLFAATNLMDTPRLCDPVTVSDDFADLIPSSSSSHIRDLPITAVNRAMFERKRQ